MRKLFYLLFLITLVQLELSAQTLPDSLYKSKVTMNGRSIQAGAATATLAYDAQLFPFYHGVASGDPLSDRVIIWTRVTPDNDQAVNVQWVMAKDPEFTQVVATGSTTTSAARDYTVKVDVTGLNPATTYYYYFNALGANSLIGRTRTTPASNEVNHLRFAVVSCSNYQQGYFNAYKRIAERNDLDAVLHLGDYIYEYESGGYGYDEAVGRGHLPEHEIIKLADYRTRYSYYHLDEDLRAVHQQHPFICVWDDHEAANDAYKDGAQNHNSATEGSWTDRKSAAKKAYFEWMPIREDQNQKIYRKVSYGNLMDLIMLDTRLEGREKQINDVKDPALYDESRTLLGQEQYTWLENNLKNSTAKWKVIGNQVIFAPLVISNLLSFTESLFLDIWDGYPAERLKLVNTIKNQDIDNVIFLTGDFHCSFAFDVPVPNFDFPKNTDYNRWTGSGSVAVEFAAPSITSANFDENIASIQLVSLETAKGITKGLEINLQVENPHLKRTDLMSHGYFVLDVNQNRVQADYFFVPTTLSPSNEESFAFAYYTNNEANKLRWTWFKSPGKAKQEKPAPATPLAVTANTQAMEQAEDLVVFSVYPNPTRYFNFIQYGLNKAGKVNISLLDGSGMLLKELVNEEQEPNNYTLSFRLPINMQAGVYYLRFKTAEQTVVKRLLVE